MISRDAKELRAASKHLGYEVDMLRGTADRLLSGMEEGVAKNAFLESFTVHARALVQFFFGAKSGDVLADHYVLDVRMWRVARGKLPRALKDVADRVGKEIVHLSYGRLVVGPDANNWNVHAVHAALMELCEKFIRHVPAGRLDERFLGLFAVSSVDPETPLLPANTKVPVTAVNSPTPGTFYSAISTKGDD
jgi:hypothetical protein